MGILNRIKEESKKSGQSKGKFIYFREGEKKRIRFLTDFEDGMEITFHDSYEKGINVPCQTMYGKDCEYCEMEGLRTRSLFAWSVWDYDAKEVKIFMQAVNNCTAIPAIMALYESYGTLLDRDLVITKTGKQQNTTFAVVPQDKNSFKNTKAKPLSETAVLKFLAKAYPDENAEEEDEEDDYEEEEKSTKKKGKSSKDEDWEESTDDAVDYEDMTAKELFKLCRERGIEVMPKKPEKYYIRKLEEYDQAQDDWEEDEEDDDDWEE